MPWFKVEDTFRDHPKFTRLARILGISETLAKGHVINLWAWVTRFAADGSLVDYAAPEIAEAAKWPPEDADGFLAALLEVRLLDRVRNVLHVHGWMERAEGFKAATRKQNWRRTRAATIAATVARDSAVRRDGVMQSVEVSISDEAFSNDDGTVDDYESDVPAFTDDILDVPSPSRPRPANGTSMSRGRGEEKRGEEKRGADQKRAPTLNFSLKNSESGPEDLAPAVLVFTCIGVGAKSWALQAKMLEQWTAIYPAIDVLSEMRRAWAWVDADPLRRMTAKGMKRFLVGWLNRARPAQSNGSRQPARYDGRPEREIKRETAPDGIQAAPGYGIDYDAMARERKAAKATQAQKDQKDQTSGLVEVAGADGVVEPGGVEALGAGFSAFSAPGR